MTEVEAVLRRVADSTNFRRVHDPSALPSEAWRERADDGGEILVRLRGREESFRQEEYSGPEVNELAGRVVVKEPYSAPHHEGGVR